MSTAASLLVAVAYLAIAGIVLRGLARSGQLRSNRLGLATGLIFLAGAVHHGLLGFGWPSAAWDLLSAAVATFYLSQRGQYARLLTGASMFEDLRARERQALEINDNIVQGLARVKWALEAGRDADAHEAADRTLAEAQRMVTDLLMVPGDGDRIDVARLRRDAPAGVATVRPE